MNTSWLDRSEYPFASHYFSVEKHRLHYLDEGNGATLLFVHGTPSWSFDFRGVIKILKNQFRCVAIDHIGFGLSDKPESYDYSTVHHSETLENFILAKDLKDITLVVHDFGGPIGLHFALRHPERIQKIVILNSWMWSSQSDPDFIRFSKILRSPLLPILYRYFNFSPAFVLPRSFGEHKLTSALKKQYSRPFAKPSERNGTLAFAHSLLQDQDWFESLWEKRNILQHKPVLIVWGLKDPVLLPKYLDKFRVGFPQARCCPLLSSGHFPQEEQPEKVAKEILRFMTQ